MIISVSRGFINALSSRPGASPHRSGHTAAKSRRCRPGRKPLELVTIPRKSGGELRGNTGSGGPAEGVGNPVGSTPVGLYHALLDRRRRGRWLGMMR